MLTHRNDSVVFTKCFVCDRNSGDLLSLINEVPTFKINVSWQGAKGIGVEDLISHLAGFGDKPEDKEPDAA
ncbi:hypothetical protein CapIbe_010124 [Capra ibex]